MKKLYYILVAIFLISCVKNEPQKIDIVNNTSLYLKKISPKKITSKVLKGHNDWVYSVAISPDGRYALSGNWDKTLRYWNLAYETLKSIK